MQVSNQSVSVKVSKNTKSQVMGILAAAAIATLTGSAYGQQVVQPGDIAIGLGGATGAPSNSVYLVHDPNNLASNPWSVTSNVEALQFDNYNGVLKNNTGNLLAVSFGSTPTATVPVSTAGVFSLATDGTGAVSPQLIKTTDFNPNALVANGGTRLGGLAISADNSMIAVQGYDDGKLHLFNYTAANGTASGQSSASLSQFATIGTTTGTAGTTPGLFGTSVTTVPSFYKNPDNSQSVLMLDKNGFLHKTNISGTTLTDTIVSPSPGFRGSSIPSFTDVLYDSTISKYIFASEGKFVSSSVGSVNTLFVIDPTAGFSVVNTVNLDNKVLPSTSTNPASPSALSENMEYMAFDAAGNLYYTANSGFSGTNTIINEIPNAAANALTLGGTTPVNRLAYGNSNGYGYGARFPGIDVARGTAVISNSRNLVWDGGFTPPGPHDVSGTWDNSTKNFYDPATTTNVLWNDLAPDNATFGSGSGSGAFTVTVSGTRTAASVTFAATSPTYTLTGGTVKIVGNESGVGLVVNTSANIASALQVGSGTVQANVAAGQSLAITGQITGGQLVLDGPGTVSVSNTTSTYAGIAVNAGTFSLSADNTLGSGVLSVGSGTIQLNSAALTTSKNVSFTAGVASTINIPSSNVYTISGHISGSGFTKVGTGTVVLDAAESTPFFGGTIQVNAGALQLTANAGVNSAGFSALGNARVYINSNASFQLNASEVGGANLILTDGGTVKAVGSATSIIRNGLYVLRSATPINVNVGTASATDVLAITGSVQQWDPTVVPPVPNTDYVGDTNATINLTGPGRVVLQSGSVVSQTTFAGSWKVNTGILQIGPVFPNTAASPGDSTVTPVIPSVEGPYGEPLNALGFKTPTGTFDTTNGNNGDPDLPNTVTVSTGGTLAVGVDLPNTNPNITSFPSNSTPNYLRAPVVLSGGSIASTGQEVTYATTSGTTDNEGVPNGIAVAANFGGNFTTTAGTTSKVLTYDPTSNSAVGRVVNLVGGTRTLDNQSPGFASGSVITYSTNWAGTLVIDPGFSTGGSFNILRDSGTVTVTPGATIQVLNNATLNIGKGVSTAAAAVVVNSPDTLTDSTATGINTTKSVGLDVSGVVDYAARTGTTGDTGIKLNRLSGLSVHSGGIVSIDSAASHSDRTLLTVGTLSFDSSGGATVGQIDLADNDMIVRGTSLGVVTGYLASGYNPAGGLWNGQGIESSVAHLAANLATKTLGVVSSAAVTSFDGQTVSASDVLIKYTYYGDADLNGVVTGNDYTQIDNGFNTAGSTGWQNGDFNYDGVIDGSDYSLIDNAYNTQDAVGPLAISAEQIAVSASEIAGSAVPEPGTLGILGIAAVGMLSRRRRR